MPLASGCRVVNATAATPSTLYSYVKIFSFDDACGLSARFTNRSLHISPSFRYSRITQGMHFFSLFLCKQISQSEKTKRPPTCYQAKNSLGWSSSSSMLGKQIVFTEFLDIRYERLGTGTSCDWTPQVDWAIYLIFNPGTWWQQETIPPQQLEFSTIHWQRTPSSSSCQVADIWWERARKVTNLGFGILGYLSSADCKSFALVESEDYFGDVQATPDGMGLVIIRLISKFDLFSVVDIFFCSSWWASYITESQCLWNISTKRNPSAHQDCCYSWQYRTLLYWWSIAW